LLNDHAAIYQKIRIIFPHNRILIEDMDRSFRLRTTSALDEFDLHCALINLLEKSVTEYVMNFEMRLR
jgi:hypothetical protein